MRLLKFPSCPEYSVSDVKDVVSSAMVSECPGAEHLLCKHPLGYRCNTIPPHEDRHSSHLREDSTGGKGKDGMKVVGTWGISWCLRHTEEVPHPKEKQTLPIEAQIVCSIWCAILLLPTAKVNNYAKGRLNGTPLVLFCFAL